MFMASIPLLYYRYPKKRKNRERNQRNAEEKMEREKKFFDIKDNLFAFYLKNKKNNRNADNTYSA
jgi:hypothetical protein